MDCVRVSTDELEGEKYVGNYIEIPSLQGSGVDACRQACVTSANCGAWEYTPDQKCSAMTVRDGSIIVQSTTPGTRTGMIQCKADWSMLKLIWWIVILGLILVLVWYVMTKCEPRAKARGDRFFPKLYFTS